MLQWGFVMALLREATVRICGKESEASCVANTCCKDGPC